MTPAEDCEPDERFLRDERFFPEECFVPDERLEDAWGDFSDVPREGTGAARLKAGRDGEKDVPITEVGRIAVDVRLEPIDVSTLRPDERLHEGVTERKLPCDVILVTVRDELPRLSPFTERLTTLGVDTRIGGVLPEELPETTDMVSDDLMITAGSQFLLRSAE